MKISEFLIEKIRELNYISSFASDMANDCLKELNDIVYGEIDDEEVDDLSWNEMTNHCLHSLRKHLWSEPVKINKPVCAEDYIKLYKDGWNVKEWVDEIMYQWAQSRRTVYNNFKKFGIDPKKVLKHKDNHFPLDIRSNDMISEQDKEDILKLASWISWPRCLGSTKKMFERKYFDILMNDESFPEEFYSAIYGELYVKFKKLYRTADKETRDEAYRIAKKKENDIF